MGNRVYKSSTVDSTTTTRKYIVDISGNLPVILCEIDTSDGSLKKSYIYANAQILAHRAHETDPNFYDESYFVHDRLGSVKMVVDYNEVDAYAFVVNSYGYTPFGQGYGTPDETVDNPFRFTGQWYDAEIGQYYLRARQYDPAMMRFTSRDPVAGNPKESLTVHKYLYTANDPVNRFDPTGKYFITAPAEAITAGYSVHAAAIVVTAVGVANMNWNIISFGIALDRTIAPVMAIAVMFKGDLRHEKNAWGPVKKVNDGFNNNMNGGGWNNLPTYVGIGTALVLITAEIRGCDDELKGVSDFLEYLNEKSNDESPQFEPGP